MNLRLLGRSLAVFLSACQSAAAPASGPGNPAPGRRPTPTKQAPAKQAPAPGAELRLARVEGHGIPGMYQGGLAVADFDADGRPDLVMAGYFRPGRDARQNCLPLIEARVYQNVTPRGGPIQFRQAARYADLGACGAQVVTGDFDGDGRRDFALQVKNGIDTTAYFGRGELGRGEASFRPMVLEKNFGTHSSSHGIAAADIDRDGKDDLVFNSDGDAEYYKAGRGLWYRFDGRRFQPRQEDFLHSISYGGTLAAGDLDGDGYPEIAVAGNASRPFGSHDCKNLLYGQIHHNARGRIEPAPMAVVANYALRASGRRRSSEPPRPGRLEPSCAGGDNVQYAIADVDGDRHADLVVAGSGGFGGRPEMRGGAHYGLAILRNVDGTGTNFVTWENEGIGPDGGPGDMDGNSTNTGVGNVDLNGIAIGDLTGDGASEVVIQGHRRELEKDGSRYVYGVMFLLNAGGGEWRWLPGALDLPRPVGGGGSAIADLDGDGRNELLLVGAELAYHTNGSNPEDRNTPETIRAHLFRGESSPRAPAR